MEESNPTEEEQQPQIDPPEEGAELERSTPPLDESKLVPETEEISTLTPKAASTPRTSDTAPATDPSATEKEHSEMDLLSQAFDNYMRIANALMKTLKRPKDSEICADLLQRVQSLNGSQDLEVKRNNNRYFRFLLRVLKYTSENQPLDYYRTLFNFSEDNDKYGNKSVETSSWLTENKMYMALKTLKDGTFIVYVAVADEAKDGWQDGGLAVLDKKAACGRL